MYEIFKRTIKTLFTIGLIGFIAYAFTTKPQAGPISHPLKINAPSERPLLQQVFDITELNDTSDEDAVYTDEDLLAAVPEFVETPEGGVPWQTLGEIKYESYSFIGEDGEEWTGLKPTFNDNVKKLDGQKILLQGYMFPLDQNEKQSSFLLGPFPMSCPYHYHVSPNMVLEAHAKSPIEFSYDAINVTGVLELVPRDDEYNVFYRLKDVEIAE